VGLFITNSKPTTRGIRDGRNNLICLFSKRKSSIIIWFLIEFIFPIEDFYLAYYWETYYHREF